MIISKLR